MLYSVIEDVKVCLEEKKEMIMQKEINKFIEKHGDLYDYSLVNYINNITKIEIICKIHGVFEQTPHHHKRGGGCGKCTKGAPSLSKDDFIKKSVSKHGDLYDYSLVNYINNRTKVEIICNKHGIFNQTPLLHLNGSGCTMCNIKHIPNDELIKRFNDKHNSSYTYLLCEERYKLSDFIDIKCEIHGIFTQRISNHLISGCQKCGGFVYDNDDFVNKSFKVHGDTYDYSLSVYKNFKTEVNIICKKHGIFKQKPYLHTSGSGCTKCNNSKGEKIISWFLTKKGIKYETQKTFDECKDVRKLRFDFYLPDYNICIEYNGIQHYEEVNAFGGESYLKNIKSKDNIKYNYCKDNSIKLLVIKYTDIDNISNKISDYINLIHLKK